MLCAFAVLLTCATAPAFEPETPALTLRAGTQPSRSYDAASHPRSTRSFEMARTTVTVPVEQLAAPLARPAPTSIPGPAPFVLVPEPGATDEQGRPIIRESPKPPEKPTPALEKQPGPPIPVKPEEPKAPEREPEEASRKRTDKPPQPNETRIDPKWKPTDPNAPRYLPCKPAGYGGSGPFRPEKAPSDWIRCTYKCGRYEVRLYDIRQRKDENGKPKDAQAICEEGLNLRRAEEYARSRDAALKAQGN